MDSRTDLEPAVHRSVTFKVLGDLNSWDEALAKLPTCETRWAFPVEETAAVPIAPPYHDVVVHARRAGSVASPVIWKAWHQHPPKPLWRESQSLQGGFAVCGLDTSDAFCKNQKMSVNWVNSSLYPVRWDARRFGEGHFSGSKCASVR
jgi:hypothetical protein